MTTTIANALAARGHKICIISLWDTRSVFPLHPAVCHVGLFDTRPSFKAQYLATVRRLRRVLREHRVTALVEADTMLAWFTLPATLGCRIRRVGWEHCHFDEDLGRKARRVARRMAARWHNAIVVLTESDRQRWIDATHPRCPVLALPNPLPFPIPTAPARRLGKQVLAVGRLTGAKGFDTLIRAWADVTPSAPEWTLTIIGEGEDRSQLESLRAELDLVDSVQMPGTRSDIAETYRQASLFCLSSRYEGFGLVLIEAMAFGLPVVSTNCEAGPRSLLRDGENALVVPVDTPRALATALLSVMQDERRAAQLAAGARLSAQRFELAPIIDKWEALLTDHTVTGR
ncbi:glycosyltransferase [Cupriavidus sp. D384]|uniref:glycosyltransferase n=1 Tax=Cupriavidus sp. D384 TaxID=1538095 RepID=UPI001E2D61A7|nr:glycosyltransferase [Cupriavidus sp. D384]